jgi:hypothetical protein
MVIFTIVFTLLYTYLIFRWDKYVSWQFGSTASSTIKYIHYLTLFVCLTIAFTYLQFDIGLRGIWTTRIFVLIALLTGVLFYFVADKAILNKFEKIYFRIFRFFPAVTGAFLLVPFLGVVIVFSLFGRLFDPVDDIYYEDAHIWMNRSFKGVLAPPGVDFYTKHFIFEKLVDSREFNTEAIDSVAVHYDQDSTRIVVYGSPETDGMPKVICIEKQQ